MGLTLMADDRDLIIGEIRGGLNALKEHLQRQDAEAVRDREKREHDKQEAIRARQEKEARDNEKHAESTRKLDAMDRKLTTTYGLSSMNEQWISSDGKPAVEWVHEQGMPLVNRVVVLETIHADAVKKRDAAKNRHLGATAVWGSIAALVGGLATVIGFIGLDGIANVLARIARGLGAGE